MPIKGVLDLQRRSVQLGEIRIGTSVVVDGKSRPKRLNTFRFTTPSQESAQAIAEAFGGQPAPWEKRRGYWEVITDRSEIEVWVPPRGLAVDTWMELWAGSPVKCVRRCDGITETRSGKPCMCPQPDDPDDEASVMRAGAERQRLAKLQNPQACRPRTRINVTIPGLPGMTGVWRLNTSSANAAVESADTGEVLERARAADQFLPAVLLIHWRPGQDGNTYPVPVLRLRQSVAQVAAGELPSGVGGLLSQIRAASSGRLELTAGDDTPDEDAADHSDGAARAQRIADTAAKFTTREQVDALKDDPEVSAVLDEMIHAPGDADETWEPLRDYLRAHWQSLPPPEPPRRNGNGRARRSHGPEEAHAARPSSPTPSPADDDPDSLFADPNWAEASR